MADAPGVPTLREYAQKTYVKAYREKLKDWLDFRYYLRQRRLILTNPEILLDPPKGKHWKEPLEFAFYGCVVVAFITQCGGWLLENVFEIHSGNSAYTERLVKEKALLKAQWKDLRDTPADSSNYKWKEDLERNVESQLEEVSSQLEVAMRYERARDGVAAVAGRLLFIFAAGVFAWVSKGRQTLPIAVHAEVAYLYIVTASYFWLGLLDVVVSGLLIGPPQSFAELLFVSSLYGLALSVISIPIILRTGRCLRQVGFKDAYLAQVYMRVGVVQFLAFGLAQAVLNIAALIYAGVSAAAAS